MYGYITKSTWRMRSTATANHGKTSDIKLIAKRIPKVTFMIWKESSAMLSIPGHHRKINEQTVLAACS
jgi:hypothetical protein